MYLKINKLINKHLFIAAMSVTGIMTATNAQASCSRDSHNNYTCTGTIDADTAFSEELTHDATIIVEASASLNGTHYGIDVSQTAGSVVVNVDGTVTGQNNNGISVVKYSGDVTLNLNENSHISAGNNAIDILNRAGNTQINTSGTIEGHASSGINISHVSLGQDIYINQTDGSISGTYGIYTNNNGKGSTTVITASEITGATFNGIYVYNDTSSTDISVTQKETSKIEAATSGINVVNSGSGVTTITTSGTVIGDSALGIYAINKGQAGDLTITQTAGSISGGNTGMYAANEATGKTTITSSGNIMGTYSGIDAVISGEATDLNVNQQAGSIAGQNGIKVENTGVSSTTIMTASTVTGTTKNGLSILNDGTATDLTVIQSSTGNITGATNGIFTTNNTTNKTEVDISGTVTGGTGAGIYTTSASGNTNIITLNRGANVSASSGIAIQDDSGNATVTVKNGAKVTGAILLNGGSDTLNIDNGADVSALTILDGGITGELLSGTDSDTDILNINQSLTGSTSRVGSAGDIALRNWEVINIGNESNATLTLSGDLTANNVNIAADGVMNLSDQLTTATITGNITNSGIIDLSSHSTAENQLIVDGDYVGNHGQLIINSVLAGDDSDTDKFVINGNASGTTYVSVNNLGGEWGADD